MTRFAGLAALLLVLQPTLQARSSTRAADSLPPTRTTTIALPQSFIEDDVGFLMLGDGLSATLETGRMRWIVTDRKGEGRRKSVVTIEPVDAHPEVGPVGERLLPGVVSRFRGAPSEWNAGRRTFRSVRYAELWTGIDLLLEADGQSLKGTYVVAAGADPKQVRLRHSGADSVHVDAAGRLVMSTPAGDILDAAPVAWQEIDGERCDVPVAFALQAAGDGVVDVSFELGPHDPAVALSIDPAVIVQAGFLGGAEDEHAVAMAVDPAGNVYVCGNTLSDESTFPVLVGPELVWDGPPLGSTGDAFVAKLDPTGDTLLYAGFIGGADLDWARCLAVDSLGRAYIGGHTLSDESSGFPVVTGPDLTKPGGIDGWVARVSADGSSLDYCGFIGGNSEDRVFGIDVDDSFRAHVVGRFKSIPGTLPLVVGPELVPPGGSTDGFIARLSAGGTSFDYCGYVGGSGLEDITLVAADDVNGGAWFSGWSFSTDFPVVGPIGPAYSGGGLDMVVGRVADNGSAFTASGYIGSLATDVPYNLEVDDTGALYLGGVTLDAYTWPAYLGPRLVPTDATEGILMKIAPDGMSVAWSGFTATGTAAQVAIGQDKSTWFVTAVHDGTNWDTAIGRVLPSGLDLEIISVLDLPDGTGMGMIGLVPEALTPGFHELWLYGSTTADESVFPVVSGPDVTANGKKDAVVLRLQVADDPWTDLGFALAGTHGDPVLTGDGTLGPLSPCSVSLDNALENTTTWLIVGLAELNVPFKGGILVPDLTPPGMFVPFSTGPTGSVVVPFVWPAGAPSGTNIYFQHWIQDPAGPVGFSASNAIKGTTP